MTQPNMTPDLTPTEQAAVAAALARLSAYSDGFPADALVPARLAAPECGKVRGWSDCFVLVRVGPLVEWVRTLPRKAAYDLVYSEALMGWFEGSRFDDVDDEYDFMSTPSVYGEDGGDDDDVTDALEHCSRDGFLSVES